MNVEIINLRKNLSRNIKKHRELLGISQEKLAEKAGISANMVNDIEGCRTWISDKTLIKLASALGTETYRLLMPTVMSKEEITKTVMVDLARELQKIRKDFDGDFEKVLKTRGLL